MWSVMSNWNKGRSKIGMKCSFQWNLNNLSKNSERQAVLTATIKEEKELTGAMWERVARMIEGNSGAGAGGIGSAKVGKPPGQSAGKDTSRMKQLILLYARGEQNEKSPSPDIP